MNALREWRKGQGVQAKDLAAQIEVTPVALWRYEHNKRLPCAEVAKRIEHATAGAVRVDYMDRRIVQA